MSEEEINIFESYLVPKHELLNEDDKANLLKDLGITPKQLPRISSNDPAIKAFNAKTGDVIRVTRLSPVSGQCLYYRVVV
jgi:DNA-directed RNA polymerase subunit H